MGYPMTWKRVLSRNGLVDGGYTDPPQRWRLALRVNLTEKDDAIPGIARVRAEALFAADRAIQMLAGDLRRLETDTVDEKATCAEIARRTGIDADTVAAVLKEWMNW